MAVLAFLLMASTAWGRITAPSPGQRDSFCAGSRGAEACIDQSGNVLPTTDNSSTSGSSSLRWSNIYGVNTNVTNLNVSGLIDIESPNNDQGATTLGRFFQPNLTDANAGGIVRQGKAQAGQNTTVPWDTQSSWTGVEWHDGTTSPSWQTRYIQGYWGNDDSGFFTTLDGHMFVGGGHAAWFASPYRGAGLNVYVDDVNGITGVQGMVILNRSTNTACNLAQFLQPNIANGSFGGRLWFGQGLSNNHAGYFGYTPSGTSGQGMIIMGDFGHDELMVARGSGQVSFGRGGTGRLSVGSDTDPGAGGIYAAGNIQGPGNINMAGGVYDNSNRVFSHGNNAPVTDGGTGQTAYALGDILYSGATNSLSRLAGNTTTTRNFLRQTGTGSVSAAPAWDTVTKTDVGLSNVENTALSTWAGSSNLTTLGTIATGVWNGTKVAEGFGGTNQSTYTLGDTLYSSAANTLSKLAGNTTSTRKFLRQTGTGSVSAAPAWDVVFSSDVTGTATNDNAAAGFIGEYVSSTTVVSKEISLTNNTGANVNSISLTAGDWDVDGVVYFDCGGSTVVSIMLGASSTSSGNYDPSGGSTNGAWNSIVPSGAGTVLGANQVGLVVPTYRYSLSSTTTVYLVAQSGFTTSTMKAFGSIRARRVR